MEDNGVFLNELAFTMDELPSRILYVLCIGKEGRGGVAKELVISTV